MDDVNHQRIKTNGIWLHVVEKGTGPLVLLLHGFPDFCYSWRHQITFLADRGYHVVAPDLRGYGDSDAPISHTSYSILHIYLSIFRPDRVKGLIALSVPFYERNPEAQVIISFRMMYGDGFYICQFQEPGRAEQAFARYDYLTVMKKFLLMEKPEDNLVAPKAMEIIDYLETPAVLPPWITEEELQVYADKFQESGFTGPLNYYRAMDLNWEVTAPWQGSKVTVPSKFIVGNEDIGFRTSGAKQYIEGDTFRRLVPDLEVVVLDGHHFIQQERAQEVSEEIAAFLHKHSSL
ncbi:Epoxide hydrolase A [Linum perenne]